VLGHQKISKTQGGGNLGISRGDQFGRSVAYLGDVDGDGIGDLAVGAHADEDGGTLGANSKVGSVWILFLNTDGTVKARQKISATRGGLPAGLLGNGDEFGCALGALGDIDGDGVPDLAVGARNDDDGGSNTGAFYVLTLLADGTVATTHKVGPTTAGFTDALDPGDEFGRGFASLGDLDGDGIAELAVCATLDDDGGLDRGALYVLFPNADWTIKAYQKISDTEGGFGGLLFNHHAFAMSVASLGDLDDDGVVDLCVGAIGDDTDGEQRGAVWILFLNQDGTVEDQQEIDSRFGNFQGVLEDRDEFGFSVAALGDFDGDGVEDVAVGAALDDDGGPEGFNAGAVHVLFLATDGTVDHHQTISLEHGGFTGDVGEEDWWGSSVACLGDLDGDTNPDLAVGARFDDDGDLDTGAAYVLFLTVGEPRAELSASVDPLTGSVAFTDESEGHPSSWSWDFGDGATSTEADPVHVYAAPGLYTVVLDVANANGTDQTSLPVDVQIAPPLVGIAGTPTAGTAPLAVSFDGSNLGGPVTGWSWDFGDGSSSTEEDPSHVYAGAGLYTVTLTASGPGGVDALTVPDLVSVVDPAPVAAFSAAPRVGVAPLSVAFTDGSTGPITAWSWDFGDGATSTEASPSHVYAVPGLYTVTLSVVGPGGSDTLSRVDLVDVSFPAPVASFQVAGSGGEAPLPVSFTDTSDTTGGGPVDAWSWDGARVRGGGQLHGEPDGERPGR